MIIKGKTCIVYDIECLKNIFSVTVKNTETDEINVFEVSCRKNDMYNLTRYFYDNREKYYFVGYNNIHYDNPIMNYCIEYFYNTNLPTDQIVTSIYNLSSLIVNSSDEDRESFERWKKYKYANIFDSLDLLTMLYSKKLRVSLKELQVTMHYKNVEEYLVDWSKELEPERFDTLIKYNINDVKSTAHLLNRCSRDIDLRLAIESEYGINCLSKDGVSIGMEILKVKYLQKTGKSWWDIRDLRSNYRKINIGSILLPYIQYDSPILQKALEIVQKKNLYFKDLSNIDETEESAAKRKKQFNYQFVFDGLQYTIGVGGIHSVNTPEVIIPKEDEYLIDCDVASLYPSMLTIYGFSPGHLGDEFIEIYSMVMAERLEAKANKQKLKDTTLKLAINGLSGNLQNMYSWVYDPKAVLSIRMNGQMLLLMLAEKLVQLGAKIKQANTDGLFLIIKKDKIEDYYKVCAEWEALTKLKLEHDFFEKMYQYAINDYIAVPTKFQKEYQDFLNGSSTYSSLEELELKNIKYKGMFIIETQLGKGLSPKIIPQAILRYFLYGTPIETTIQSCDDIKMFLQAEKTGKQWHVTYNNEEIQRTNRYYVSTDGLYLIKWKYVDVEEDEDPLPSIFGDTVVTTNGNKSYQHMLRGYGVTLCNNMCEEFPENINYTYYIVQSRKIINELENKQLSLFE